MIRSEHPTTLVIARHAEAQKNIDKRHGGGDQSLTETGVQQALAIGSALLSSGLVTFNHVRVVHQQEGRSKNTAAIVHTVIGGTLNEEPAFNGIGLGQRAGMSEAELSASYPDLSKALEDWAVGMGFNVPSVEGGEPMQDFSDRINSGLHSQIKATDRGDTLAMVGTTSSLTMINHLLVEDGDFRRDKYLYYGAQLGSIACWQISQDRPARLTE